MGSQKWHICSQREDLMIDGKNSLTSRSLDGFQEPSQWEGKKYRKYTGGNCLIQYGTSVLALVGRKRKGRHFHTRSTLLISNRESIKCPLEYKTAVLNAATRHW